jgi:hypothetical protein
MGIEQNSSEPAGITNEAGEPEIVIKIEGITISLNPPAQAGNDEQPTDGEEDPIGC